MFRTKLLLILPLVVAVTVGQANRGYSYYGTSNVRDQRPQPIYGNRPLLLPRRPMPVTGPVTAASEAPMAPAPVLDGPSAPTAPPALAAPSYAPVLRPRPLYTPVYRPLLPPRPIRPARPLAVAPPQPSAIGEPQPPVTEAARPLPPVEAHTPEAPILPEPAVEQPEHAPISIPASQPGDLVVVEPLPEPIPTEEPAPVTEQPPAPEPIQPSAVVYEPLSSPEPIQPSTVVYEPPSSPEPIQPSTVVYEPPSSPEPIQPSTVVYEPPSSPEPIQPSAVVYEPLSSPEPIQPSTVVYEPPSSPEPIQPTTVVYEPLSSPEPIQPSTLQLASTRISFINVPQSPKPMALPPLLPKPQPVRETAFGRHRQPSVPPTTQTPSYSYSPTPPRWVATQAPTVVVTPQSHPAVTQAPGRLKFDFQCKEGNGYYSVEHECDTYIECKQNRAMKYSCPDGLHFNPAVKHFAYPCAYPSEVKCMQGDQEQNPKPTAKCPHQYGFYSMNDGDCSKYIMCQEGLATIMNCPMGLAFNPHTSTCDWPANVPQCNPNVFKDFTCPAPPEDEEVSDIIYKYRYEGQCKLYIACQLGHPRLLSCERGLSFDDASQTCIDEDYVTDCSVPVEHLQ